MGRSGKHPRPRKLLPSDCLSQTQIHTIRTQSLQPPLKMHFSSILIITALIAASSTMASDPCPAHTYPKCCGLDVLGIADIDCNTPRASSTSFDLFTDACARQGKDPKCCAIPVGGQALFCVHPIGFRDPSPAAPNNQRPLGGTPAMMATPSPASNNSPGNGNPGSGNPRVMGPQL